MPKLTKLEAALAPLLNDQSPNADIFTRYCQCFSEPVDGVVVPPFTYSKEDDNGVFYHIAADPVEYYVTRATMLTTVEYYRIAAAVRDGHVMTTSEHNIVQLVGKKLAPLKKLHTR